MIGFDLQDLRLTWRHQTDTEQELELLNATLTSHDGGTTWTLEQLAGLTQRPGNYRIELAATDSAIQDLFGNVLNHGSNLEWKHVAGDVNGDDRFDCQDLIATFTAGKYRTRRHFKTLYR